MISLSSLLLPTNKSYNPSISIVFIPACINLPSQYDSSFHNQALAQATFKSSSCLLPFQHLVSQASGIQPYTVPSSQVLFHCSRNPHTLLSTLNIISRQEQFLNQVPIFSLLTRPSLTSCSLQELTNFPKIIITRNNAPCASINLHLANFTNCFVTSYKQLAESSFSRATRKSSGSGLNNYTLCFPSQSPSLYLPCLPSRSFHKILPLLQFNLAHFPACEPKALSDCGSSV